MTAFVDDEYINRVAYRLRNFSRKGAKTWNFSCPICGDSKKKLNKARGYFLRFDDRTVVKCHNCDYSDSFGSFLLLIDPQLHKQYAIEKWKYSATKKRSRHMHDPYVVRQDELRLELLDFHMKRVTKLSSDHTCVKFLAKRKIPVHNYERLFYCEDISHTIPILFPRYKEEDRIPLPESRLIIPCYDEHGNVLGVQCRALDDNPVRYLTYRADDSYQFMFGLDKFNKNLAPAYVIEGPFDSMFFDNAIAVCTSALVKAERYVDKDTTVFIHDNQPRNREICNQVKKTIDKGFSVFLWPSNIESKDINDLVTDACFPIDQLPQLISRHTYRGLAAQMQFAQWCKVDYSAKNKIKQR